MTRTEVIAAELRESAELKRWAAENLATQIAAAADRSATALRQGGKVVFCGNGGSAADSQHLAAELVGRFKHDRRPLPALALTTDTSILTALANDYSYEHIFARQAEALLNPVDVLVAISTSGRSPNVVEAVKVARQKGAFSIGLLGGDGEPLRSLVDLALVIPSTSSARTQECHIAIGHVICGLLEDDVAGR
ncbi:MAG: SIS domain-containing protein [Chloroflexota bacterium]|nr:MAG: SIS domain-containing protein [Chloroflexota bacterium]